MDSRLLFSATQSLLYKVAWQEWIHFNQPPEVSLKEVNDSIKSQFGTEQFYVIHTRTNGFEISLNETEKITSLLGTSDFFLWDKDLKNVIEFNKIGTLRKGQINT